MNEFFIINNYLKKLVKKNTNALNLSDDIFLDKKKKIAISIDTYVHGVHFLSLDPNKFLKRILRASLSDLYAKGINPSFYFLSLSVNKKIITNIWLKKLTNILKNEQKKFNIHLSGGDIVFSKKLNVSITVLGYPKNKPILRSGSNVNDDVYITGDVGESYLGLKILTKKYNFRNKNKYFVKKYYEPNLSTKFSKYLSTFANSSIDISDGVIQDLQHICTNSKKGAFIDLNLIPLSSITQSLIKSKKINFLNIFSRGDDYKIIFTSNKKNRSKISAIASKTNTKVSKIGYITKKKGIVFRYNKNNIVLDSKNTGYTHNF